MWTWGRGDVGMDLVSIIRCSGQSAKSCDLAGQKPIGLRKLFENGEMIGTSYGLEGSVQPATLPGCQVVS